jgi:two-component system sensor histidine kinase/response regulator
MDVILNVDDYGPGRYARTKVLRQAGFSVLEAGTGQEALDLIVANQPTLVLLDVNLPDINGFEVCKTIRRDPATRSITVVHISASNVQTKHQVEGLDCGADGYLVEPVDPQVLIATIKAFLRARRAEEALRRSNDYFQWFGYRVAHDLSEPLRTMIAHTQLLERNLASHLDESSTENIRFVVSAGLRMKSFIDGLLKYAQSTDVVTELDRLDCEAILAQVLQGLEVSIQESGAQISHDPLPEIFADSGIENVFQNLISNAIKYRRPDVAPAIHVSAKLDGKNWVFSVRDNGVGIDPSERDEVFKMFRRLHGPGVPGNGIGLALSKKIMEAHSGSIWVESDPATGSTFYFSLPKDATDVVASVRRASAPLSV